MSYLVETWFGEKCQMFAEDCLGSAEKYYDELAKKEPGARMFKGVSEVRYLCDACGERFQDFDEWNEDWGQVRSLLISGYVFCQPCGKKFWYHIQEQAEVWALERTKLARREEGDTRPASARGTEQPKGGSQ